MLKSPLNQTFQTIKLTDDPSSTDLNRIQDDWQATQQELSENYQTNLFVARIRIKAGITPFQLIDKAIWVENNLGHTDKNQFSSPKRLGICRSNLISGEIEVSTLVHTSPRLQQIAQIYDFDGIKVKCIDTGIGLIQD